MKTIIGIFMIVSCLATAMQAQDNFIEKHMKAYQEDEDFTSIDVSLSNLLSTEMLKDIQKELGDMEGKFAKLIKNLSQMTLLTTDKGAQAHYDRALSLIKKSSYTSLMTVKKGKNAGMNILVKERGKKVEEVLMLAGGKDDFVLISFSDR